MRPTPADSRAHSAHPRLPLWAVLCFLCSGAAGLIYEVVWSKQLGYLLGGSIHSVATVVAAFLGGLALGARVLGGPLARRPDLARTYAALELGVAALGVCMLPLLRSLDGPVGELYRTFGGESVAFAVARVTLLAALLVPPAALMGATLPVLVARVEHGLVGSGLAWLYAINTIGAVLGSVVAGYVLLPALGLTAATAVAAALNLVAAAVAWMRPARDRAAPERPAHSHERIASLLAPGPHRVFALLFAIGGFTALMLQLAWVRLFGLVLGSSVYSFSSVLGIYLLGLALGSAAVSRPLARGHVSPAWFALLQLGIAATSVAGIHAYAGLPKAMLDLGERTGASWAGLLAGELALVATVLFVPCLLLGAAFPVATRLLQRGEAGETTGAAYAVNTLGTIVGSLATGFLLLPWLGVQGVVRCAAVIAGLTGLAALLLPSARRPAPRTFATAGALALVAAVAGITAPPWDPLLMSLGTYRPFSAQNLLQSFRGRGGTGDPTRQLAASQQVLFYEDGINTSVLVATDAERRKLWMRVGGKVDASTGDMLTQVLCGMLPALMADSGARTLIVGHGSGVTAAAALDAGVGPTEIVELEPAVIQGSRFFHEPGRDPLLDPRVTLHLEDARTRLAHGGGEYGVVISEPSNPWVAGVNNLFTVDFYRRARARLREDGVFCQWIQLYELTPRTFRSLLASYLEVFPDAHLFILSESTDALLVAAPAGRRLPLTRLSDPALRTSLERALLTDPAQVAAFYVASGPALREMAKGAELNTDERPFVEYQAPRDMIEVGGRYGSHHPELPRMFPLTLVPPPGGPLADWPRERVLEWRARRRLSNLEATAATIVLAELRSEGLGTLAEALEAERIRAVSATAAVEPLGEARSRLAAGDVAGARTSARRALEGLAGPARLEPLLLLGVAEFGGDRDAEAVAAFREAQEVAPQDNRGYHFEARVLLAANDVAGARRALERGLSRAPGDTSLVRALRVLEGTAP